MHSSNVYLWLFIQTAIKRREELTVLSQVYDFIPLLTVSEMRDQTQSDNHWLVMAAGAGRFDLRIHAEINSY